jgi:hypothetical protein
VLIAALATDVTDPSGYYYFDQLNAGEYVVYIPSLNFASGAALEDKESVPRRPNRQYGQRRQRSWIRKVNGGIRIRRTLTLTPNVLPTNEPGAGGSGTGSTGNTRAALDDNNVNETMDFGFRHGKSCPR